MTIGFACDHTGVAQKLALMEHLENKGFVCTDFGTQGTESVDYPDFAHALAAAIVGKKADCGIALCGTGGGMVMTLNKHRGIRAGVCWNTTVAQLLKQHNNANVCVMPARFVTEKEMLEMADAYVAAVFEGGRHARRVEKIDI